MSETTKLKHCKITKIECVNENTDVGWDYINLGATIKPQDGTDAVSGLVWPLGNLGKNFRGAGFQNYNPMDSWVREWRGQGWKAVIPYKAAPIVQVFDEDPDEEDPKFVYPSLIIKEGFERITFKLYDNQKDGSEPDELGSFTVEAEEEIGNPKTKTIEAEDGGIYKVTYQIQPLGTAHLSGEPAKIDAAFLHPNGNYYFFYENAYARFPDAGVTMAPGYPLPIEGSWKNVPGSFLEDIDAALNGEGIKDGFWWFKKDQFIDFGGNTATMPANGGPRQIKDEWNIDTFVEGIDAAFAHRNGYTYMFKGKQYLRLNKGTKTKGSGYPTNLPGGWSGLNQKFSNGIDAALRHPNGNSYFFAGDEYVRFTGKSTTVDKGYPKPIKGNWDFIANIKNPAQEVEPRTKTTTLQFAEYLRITLPRIFEQLAGMTPVHGTFEGKTREDSWNYRPTTIIETEVDGHGTVTVYNPQWLVSSLSIVAEANDVVRLELNVGVLDKIKSKEETEGAGSTDEYTAMVMYYKIDWEKNTIALADNKGFPVTLNYNQDSGNKPIFSLIDVLQTIPGIGDAYGVFKSVVVAADKLGAFDKKDKGQTYLSTITNLMMLLQDGAIKTIFRSASTSELHALLNAKTSFETTLSSNINKAFKGLASSHSEISSFQIPTMFQSDSAWVMMISMVGKSNNEFIHSTPIFSLETGTSQAKLEAASFYVLVSEKNSYATNWANLEENGRSWKEQLLDDGTKLDDGETDFLNAAIEMLDEIFSAVLQNTNA